MLLDLMKSFSFFHRRLDDSLADRLNYYHTATLLLSMSLLVSFKMFGGRPVECWLPAEYSKSWEEYAEMFCWSQNTYWIPYQKALSNDAALRPTEKIAYYQWVPFFFLFQAMLFYAPNVFWKSLNDRSGVNISDLVSMARDPANVRKDVKEGNLKSMSDFLISVFLHKLKLADKKLQSRTFSKFIYVTYVDSYMCWLYVTVKALYLVNSIFQTSLVNIFLQTEDSGFFGWRVLHDLLQGKTWEQSGYFPRAVLCDMQVRVMGNVQSHTVQCVLVINIFTEKFFILLCLWLPMISLFNLISLISWSCNCFSKRNSFRFVRRNLSVADPALSTEWIFPEVQSFVTDYLKTDGVFVLRMLSMHVGSMFTAELILTMWKSIRPYELKVERQEHKQHIYHPVITTWPPIFHETTEKPTNDSVNVQWKVENRGNRVRMSSEAFV